MQGEEGPRRVQAPTCPATPVSGGHLLGGGSAGETILLPSPWVVNTGSIQVCNHEKNVLLESGFQESLSIPFNALISTSFLHLL